ncbi:carbohydrate-binding domain-containing protein [Glutamicibacter sp.]|uniref:carbohydrate-binding domain-containing protein n=1 Tax=Glutamicibacter sp. TaxID=1931995 RepID=UPI0028BDE313|nr:carbohydrate-binding domain-containing protein [Glutamicibacter sp.]
MSSSSRLRAAISAAALILAVSLTGCAAGPVQTVADVTGSTTVQSEALTSPTPDRSSVPLARVAEHTGFIDADLASDAGKQTRVTLDDSRSSASGNDASSVVSNGRTTSITGAGTYKISGKLSDGQLRVDASGKDAVRLILDGVQISSSQGPALSIQGGQKVVVELAAGSHNSLTQGTEAAPGGPPNHGAALYSQTDLAITGRGSLAVGADYGDGIRSTQGLLIAGGQVMVRAAGDGLTGDKFVAMTGGNYTVTAAARGVHSSSNAEHDSGWVHQYAGQLSISAGVSGISGATNLTLSSGSVMVSESVQGLQGPRVQITGGRQTIFASKHGIEAEQQLSQAAGAVLEKTDGQPEFPGAEVRVSGGQVAILGAEQAIDSDGDIYLDSGDVLIAAPEARMGQPLSSDGTIRVDRAVLALDGAQNPAMNLGQNFGQNTIEASFDVPPPAGNSLQIIDEASTVIASFPINNAVHNLQVTSGLLEQGESYQLYAGAPKKPGSQLSAEDSGSQTYLATSTAHR